jgi:hypothetical protein
MHFVQDLLHQVAAKNILKPVSNQKQKKHEMNFIEGRILYLNLIIKEDFTE